MSKIAFQAMGTNNNVDNFKDWVQKLSDALTTVGFVKTNDTGQLDIADISAVPSANTYAGFEIRKLDDSLFAANPILLKIEYGSGSSPNYPGLRLTMGHDTDGAGNLVGQITDSSVINFPDYYNTAPLDCYASCGEGYVSVAMFCGYRHACGFYIARSSDPATGIPNAYGAHLVCDAGSNGLLQQGLRGIDGGKMPSSQFLSPVCAAPYSGNGTYGNNIGVFPIFFYDGYPVGPDYTGVAYFNNDIQASGTQFTLTINGITRTFVTIGGLPTSNSGKLNDNSLKASIMVRYE